MGYIRDNTALPTGKSDYRTLASVPAGQKITAAEHNTIMAAVADARSWMLGDQANYFVLANGSDGVSAANTSRIRASSNRLQVSENGAVYQSVRPDGYNVRDFGAVGDGVTDDAAAIQAAMDAAFAAGKTLYFDAKTYLVNTELKVVVANVRMLGQGQERTIIKAGAAMRAVLRLGVDSGEAGSHTTGTFEDFSIRGNRLAKYGLMLLRCSNSMFVNMDVQGATKDGVFLAHKNTDDSVLCINDNNTFINPRLGGNGTIYGTTEFDDPSDAVADTRHVGYYVPANQFSLQTTTVTRTSGSPTLTGSVGTTFITWGFRSGDPIRVGVSPNTEVFAILTVDSETQITLAKNSGISSSGQPWSCGVGSGYWEDGHSDNNINKIYGGLLRSNAGYAMAFRGIYGPMVDGVFIDYHRYWAIRVGNDSGQYYAGGTAPITGGGMGPVITSHFRNIYFEAIGKKPFYFLAATDANVSHPMDTGYDSDPYDLHTATVTGSYTNKRGVHDLVVWETAQAGGSIRNYLPSHIGEDFSNMGKLSFDGKEYIHGTHWDVATTLPLTKVHNSLNPNGALRTVTATPSFTLSVGQLAIVQNKPGSGFNIVLQDETSLAGSKLFLNGSANVTLTPGSTITLLSDSSYWYEIGRNIR